ncbi:hypothetical protein BKA81DRAFT_171504 [Phyllosticta paracitricarpa]|uniref:Zn(2)-C6 fungal-type domain-containing protein n=1 Tax=Phyllosticta paracitricarpa TaxID=2016321 RepID=A0ABR1NC17_9PEZI
MAQEPRDLVMRNAPEYPASAAVGFTAVNSRPSRAQAAKLDMVAPPGTQSSLETSPETTALQEDLPTEHGHALGKTERVVDPTPPTDPQSRRTNSPSPYKRPTDFRIIPYTPPAEKKRKRLATDDPNDDSERPSPESHARAASDDHGSTSNLESDDDDDDDSPEAGMRPVEDQDPESAQSRNPSLDRHHQKQSQAQAKVARSTAGDQRESHGQKQSERTDSAYDNAGAISHIIEKPEDQDPEEGHGSALKKETALSSRLSSENPGITEITKAGVQIDPQKKRKRNFSNRTKTGCQTCRRRKKKCDETKPICNNCFRGGFICEGYLTTSWPKSGIPKTTPIQSKQSFSESPRIFPRPIGEQASDNRGPIRTEESQPRLPAISEESQCDFRGQWGSPRDEQPPHRPYSQDRSVGPEYPLIMARAPSDPYRRPSDVEPGQQDQPVSWVSEQQKDQHSQRAGLFRSVLDAQLTPLARGTRYNQERPLPPPQTIFEIMKKGRPYSRSDPVLVEFRKRCKALLRKYNFALMAGICEDGDMRLLRDVIMPPLDGPGEESFKTGRLAEDARIEGPFTCDYGWNVTLGEKVAIGPNCNFEDGAEIFIGPRTVIGPDVKIYTSDPWKWPFREDGNEVKTISRRIVIEEDVFIGGNSTILSGIRIKKGTIVAAGSVLNRRMFGPDGVIPERSFVTGNPARVLRDVP